MNENESDNVIDREIWIKMEKKIYTNTHKKKYKNPEFIPWENRLLPLLSNASFHYFACQNLQNSTSEKNLSTLKLSNNSNSLLFFATKNDSKKAA